MASSASHTLSQARAPLEEAPNRANAQVDSPVGSNNQNNAKQNTFVALTDRLTKSKVRKKM